MKARDVMEKVDKTLSPDESLLDAIEKMAVTRRAEGVVGVKGMLVIDSAGSFVGTLSLKNIFKAVVPTYLLMEESLSELAWEGMLEEKLLPGLEKKKVKEVMDVVSGSGYEKERSGDIPIKHENGKVVTVRESASLMECVVHMLYHDTNRIPVLNDEGGEVVGIIYSRDMYKALEELIKRKLEERR